MSGITNSAFTPLGELAHGYMQSDYPAQNSSWNLLRRVVYSQVDRTLQERNATAITCPAIVPVDGNRLTPGLQNLPGSGFSEVELTLKANSYASRTFSIMALNGMKLAAPISRCELGKRAQQKFGAVEKLYDGLQVTMTVGENDADLADGSQLSGVTFVNRGVADGQLLDPITVDNELKGYGELPFIESLVVNGSILCRINRPKSITACPLQRAR